MTRIAAPEGPGAEPAPDVTTPPESPGHARPPRAEGPALDGGSAPRLSSVTDSLRRARVRAAALFLVVTLGALLVWRAMTVGGQLLYLQGAVVCGLGVAVVLLGSRMPLSDRAVRGLELAVFGMTAAYLAARQYQQMHVWVARGDEVSLIVAVKTTLIGTILLAFAYGMLIPNTWRRAARVIGAILALPVLTELLLLATHPDAFAIAWRFASAPRVSEDALQVLLAAGLSVYGTHVINTLRSEAFEARQLNQYRLGPRLGEGGMGEVYLGVHRLLKRPCAIKLVLRDAANDPASVARFEREVRATARLSHPNTVEVYDYGRTDAGTFYYVMEYLRGLSLEEIVRRHGPLPPGRVVHLLRQVCGALAEAHGAGLIHRDVKPANVFACYRAGRHDVAKLLDFGLVRAEGPDEPDGPARGGRRVRGTPLYMAPEQVVGSPTIDHRCDLYALGGVAYTLLTGRPPFDGKDSTRVMAAHVRDPVPPPRLARPDVPEDVERVVLRCLAKSPDARYPDADHLAEALAACASAGEWDDVKAARWWHTHEPLATAPPPD